MNFDGKLEPLEDDGKDCIRCGGWGFVLGTETDDKWGDVCGCFNAPHYPSTPSECAELREAHGRARVQAATKRTVDWAMDRIAGVFGR